MKQSFTLDHSNADLLAYLYEGMTRLYVDVGAENAAADKGSYAEQVGTTEDRMYRAMIMISARMVSLLPPVIEAAYKDESMKCSVWVYDFMDYNASGRGRADCDSLPAYLWRWLEANPDHWISSAEFMREDKIPLQEVLSGWCELIGLKMDTPQAA